MIDYNKCSKTAFGISKNYCNGSKFSGRHALVNSADTDQTALRSSLISVSTVCHSIWTFSTNFVERHLCLNLRVITANNVAVRKFRTFTVYVLSVIDTNQLY